MSTWFVAIEGTCRQLLGVLPTDKSLAAITICAVVYGAACWTISKALLAAAGLGRNLLQKAVRRRSTRLAS